MKPINNLIKIKAEPLNTKENKMKENQNETYMYKMEVLYIIIFIPKKETKGPFGYFYGRAYCIIMLWLKEWTLKDKPQKTH